MVDDKTTLNTRLKELKDNLKYLGCLKKMIESCIKKARDIQQEQLRETKEKSNKEKY